MVRETGNTTRVLATEDWVDTMSDEEVVAKVLAGEKELYEIIMRRYNQRMFRISRAYVHDGDEAEEIVEQAYINAYEHLPSFERRSRFSTWLTRIVINEALRRQREKQRSVSLEADSEVQEIAAITMQTSDTENPAETVMNNELRSILERTIDELPPIYRSVFVMREIEEMSIAETSESLGITPANVKVRLNRAKEMLRQNIGSVCHEAEVYHFDLVRCDRIVAHVLAHISGA